MVALTEQLPTYWPKPKLVVKYPSHQKRSPAQQEATKIIALREKCITRIRNPWRKKIAQSSYKNAPTKRAVEGSERKFFRHWLFPAALWLLSAPILAADTINPKHFHFDIPQQRADTALTLFAEQANLTLVFPFDKVREKTANRLIGSYTLEEAINILLADTGLLPTFSSQLVLNITTESSGDKMNIKREKASILGGIAAFFASIVGAPNVVGQETVESDGRVLDEIIVTAEKREQNLQEVPVAISAFTADMLKARGIDTPQDLQLAVPGLMIGEQNNTGGTAKATIRGVGSENYGPGGDPGVPLHINGHYTQSTAYVFRDMIDVERVEVQRGPQGTLYGRNAVGGNINIITKRPTEEFEGSVGVDLGNYNKHQIQAIVSGPLSDRLRGRIVVADTERDGFVEDIGLVGEDRNTADYTSIRGALEFDLAENVQLYLNAYYFDDTGNTYTRRLDSNPANIANTEPFKVRTNTLSEDSDESTGVSIDLSWDLDGMEFRSLTAYDDTYKTSRFDIDSSDTRSQEFNFGINHETMTQEFQLLSTGDGLLQWVTGIFYYEEESDLTFDIRVDSFDTDGNGLTILDGDTDDPRTVYAPTYYINAKSVAAYGQVDYAFTDQLELIAGLRYTKDKKDRLEILNFTLEDGGSVSLFGGFLVAPTLGQVINDQPWARWEEITGKLGLNYHVDEDVMLYASYSRGYKAGGFDSGQPLPYDPEYIDAYESGIKSQWLGNQVQVNLAAFYYDYTDKQDFQRFPVTATNPIARFLLINAAKATSYGLELEFQAYLTDAFFIDGSVSYLNAEFDEYDTLDSITPPPSSEVDPITGQQSLAGNKLPLSPEWKFNVGAQYEWVLNGNLGSLSVRGDYVWVDDQYGSAFNREGTNLPGDGDLIPSYHIVNGQLQWESADAAWLAQLYVRNLTDEIAVSNAFTGSTGTGPEVFLSHLAPRTYGLKLAYRF